MYSSKVCNFPLNVYFLDLILCLENFIKVVQTLFSLTILVRTCLNSLTIARMIEVLCLDTLAFEFYLALVASSWLYSQSLLFLTPIMFMSSFFSKSLKNQDVSNSIFHVLFLCQKLYQIVFKVLIYLVILQSEKLSLIQTVLFREEVFSHYKSWVHNLLNLET